MSELKIFSSFRLVIILLALTAVTEPIVELSVFARVGSNRSSSGRPSSGLRDVSCAA